ncbi:MAG: hypothetical protein HYT87_07180 [Nitrospirae bacterium]|nr:hypothetical protein [Nitrospirota bacterium]
MANRIEGFGAGASQAFNPVERVRTQATRPDQSDGADPSAPRIQDSVTSRRIKNEVNAPGQMGPLSPAEHRIVQKVQESLEGSGVTAAGGQAANPNARPGGRIDILA